MPDWDVSLYSRAPDLGVHSDHVYGSRRPQLLRKADRMGARMVGYDHQKGEWTLEVAHF